jgi:hypothetical protein
MTNSTSNLIPGAVWQRNAKGKTSDVTIIAVSNESLSEEMQEKYPQQVVFVRDTGAILSQTPELFMKSREFVGVDDRIVNLIELMRHPEGDEVDELDIDAITLDEDSQEEPLKATRTITDKPLTAELPADERVIPVFEPPSVTLDGITFNLDEAFVGFRSVPYGSGNIVKIEFALSQLLTRESLGAVFQALPEFTIISVELSVDATAKSKGVVYVETSKVESTELPISAELQVVEAPVSVPQEPVLIPQIQVDTESEGLIVHI